MMNLKNNWKMYVSLVLYALLGLAIGYGVAKGVMYFSNKKDTSAMTEEMKQDEMMASTTSKYSGSVVAMFEGENRLDFSFRHDKALTVTQGSGNTARYFYVKNADKNIAVVYLSYEGGRGYSASDYVANTISPRVAGLGAPETMTHASSTWMHVANAGTDWHLMPVNDGEWLVVIESSKANKDLAKMIFETFKVDKEMSVMMNDKASSTMMMDATATMEIK